MYYFTEVDLTMTEDEEVADPVVVRQVMPLYDSDGVPVVPEGRAVSVSLGPLISLEIEQLENTGRVRVADSLGNKTLIQQMVDLAQTADASSVYHKFCWIPTDEELGSAIKKLPRKYKKVHADVSTKNAWFAEPTFFSELTFFSEPKIVLYFCYTICYTISFCILQLAGAIHR